MINAGLHHLLDEGVIRDIDDILIYTETEVEPVQLVQNVLQGTRTVLTAVRILSLVRVSGMGEASSTINSRLTLV